MQFPFSIPADRRFDAVGFGTNAVDHLIIVPEYPQYNTKIKLNEHIRAAGGEAASTMAGLSRLGMRTSYVGRFGSDEAGAFGLASLAADSVDTTFAERVSGARTQVGYIIIDVRTGERTVIWDRDEALAYTANEAPADAVESCRVLHMTPHDAWACVEMAKAAKAAGSIVSLDIDNVFDGVEELLAVTDVLIMSADLPERFIGIKDRRTAVSEIARRFGSAVAGITLGESGSLLLVNGTFIESSAYAVPGGCKDTTGAGDAFRVGLLYGLLNGESVETAAKMANAAAALKCRAIGARTSLPTRDELTAMIG